MHNALRQIFLLASARHFHNPDNQRPLMPFLSLNILQKHKYSILLGNIKNKSYFYSKMIKIV